MNNRKFKEFLNDRLKEYYISSLVSAHPLGVNCYDFKITRLPENSLLVSEFLMEKVGITLKESIRYKTAVEYVALKMCNE